MESNTPIDASFGAFLWCELCGYVYGRSAWEAANATCPNCGATLVNARPWDDVRALNPQYPATPIEGKKYALYGNV